MTAERTATIRPRVEVAEVSDRLLAILDAMEGMSDEEAALYWDAVAPRRSEPGAWMEPQSDGRHLHAISCGAVAGPDHGGLTAGELPTDEMIDRAVALSRTGTRPGLDEIA